MSEGRLPVPTGSTGADRVSRITTGTRLLHADLHNHTLLSDGDGDPDKCFASMQDAGLDVAAITDHSTVADHFTGPAGDGVLPHGYRPVAGLAPTDWVRLGALADAHDRPGLFTAIRGFEWSEPRLGHVNVWGSRDYSEVLELGRMQAFYRWLNDAGDGLSGFNHPGREPQRFEEFRFDPAAAGRMVSLEMFNRWDDYLFEGYADGRASPLVTCLGAGWRTGLSGVTDEHGDDWGIPTGKGRTGLWVAEHTRRGVADAMRARRFFATRTAGLRVDATAQTPADEPVPMGGVLRLDHADVRFTVDVDRGADWAGKPLALQVLRPGDGVPEVVEVAEGTCGELICCTVRLDRADGDWVVLRISDPAGTNGTPGPEGHPCNDLAVAYVSPWWLQPAAD